MRAALDVGLRETDSECRDSGNKVKEMSWEKG